MRSQCSGASFPRQDPLEVAGVVHEHVDAPGLRQSALGEPVDLGPVREIGLEEDGLAPEGLRLLGDGARALLAAAVVDQEIAAGGGEGAADGGAEAGCRRR